MHKSLCVARRGVACAAIAIALAACAGSPRPAVVPRLDSQSTEPETRQDSLDSARARPGPEARAELSPKAQKLERTAATAAAVVGMLFSTSENVSIGVAFPFDESLLYLPRSHREDEDEDEEDDGEPDAGELLPWIRLDPKTE